MKTVEVTLPEKRSYPIYIGKNILFPATKWLRDQSNGILIYDKKLENTAQQLADELKCALYPFEATEKAKELYSAIPLYEKMAKEGLDRRSVLFALGGGVIGDLAGFVAATFLRGIRWVGIPSTLLAQVDSSIGGKTGVNLPFGKNLVGTFHQPAAVILELSLLDTLSRRDRISGLAEVIKYGLIFDPNLFAMLSESWESYLSLDEDLLTDAVVRSAQWKAKVVMEDEFDAAGKRQVLNFGHTFAHAIESTAGYGRLRHGEAVILGMRMALVLSVVRGHLQKAQQGRIERFLGAIKIDGISGLNKQKIYEAMQFDKKKVAGKIGFVLLREIGETVIDEGISEDQINLAIREIL